MKHGFKNAPISVASLILPIAFSAWGWTAVGCEARRVSNHTESASEQRVLGVPRPEAQDSLGRLIERLRFMKGEFVRLTSQQWEFVGDKELFRQIAGFGDSAVARLVQCLDKTDHAAATAAGRPVLLGVMCHEALDHTAYYEWYEYQTEKYAPWAGNITPDAGPDELRAAKIAWQEVVEKNRYILQ